MEQDGHPFLLNNITDRRYFLLLHRNNYRYEEEKDGDILNEKEEEYIFIFFPLYD